MARKRSSAFSEAVAAKKRVGQRVVGGYKETLPVAAKRAAVNRETAKLASRALRRIRSVTEGPVFAGEPDVVAMRGFGRGKKSG